MRQRTGSFIGLLIVLLFFPIHLFMGSDSRMVMSVVFQSISFVVSLGMFAGDRGIGAVAVVLGTAFGIVGIILAMLVSLMISLSGVVVGWG